MTRLMYCYPAFKSEGEGHIYRDWRPGIALCSKLLGEADKDHSRSRPMTGWKLCDRCKAKRARIKAGINLDWGQIDPQSEDFMTLKPEEKYEVLAARQAARERNRES